MLCLRRDAVVLISIVLEPFEREQHKEAAGLMCYEIDSCFYRFNHTRRIGFGRSSDIECRSMIDRGSNNGQSDGNIDARLKPKKFYRYVALVVIHRNDQIKVSSTCKIKECVRWMRAG